MTNERMNDVLMEMDRLDELKREVWEQSHIVKDSIQHLTNDEVRAILYTVSISSLTTAIRRITR